MPGREISDDDGYREVLTSLRSIAVLGAHHVPQKAAFYVPQYMTGHGYKVYGVNPKFAGQEFWEEPVVANLTEVTAPVEVVNIFRRSEFLPDHVDEILAMNPRPKLVWLQLGIRNDEVAQTLMSEGIDVIQDACMLAEHRRLLT